MPTNSVKLLASRTATLLSADSIIGALCSTSVTFIVPGGCYVALFAEHGWGGKRLLALIQLILGLIIAPLCLVLTFVPMKE